jgi:hypothetical protein
MKPALVLVVYLAVPGLLPALVVARRAPVVIFLAPLIGAAMAAVAAGIELGAGGTLLRCYLLVTVIVNAAAAGWWLAAGRRTRWDSPPTGWSALTVAVMAAALVLPLTALRVPGMGWDTNSIWLTHSLMVAGGHHALLTGLRNPADFFDNPDYPPLVPATGALELLHFGPATLHSAVVVTELLTACAVAAVGCLIATAVRNGSVAARLAALAVGGVMCLAAFAVADPFAVDGYADPLWAAAAAAAVICGLVLPRAPQSLLLAWIFAVVASLTKNEGLTSALVILVLIALRYQPVRWRRSGQRPAGAQAGPPGRIWRAGRQWATRAAYVLGPALPGLAWAALARHIGLQNSFFIHNAGRESLGYRAGATISGMAAHLNVLPAALAVLMIGCCFIRGYRREAGLANPAWLWLGWLGSLATIFATYVFGDMGIQEWLRTSVDRTTIFAQLLLYVEIALWLVIAFDAAAGRPRRDRPGGDAVPGPSALAAPAAAG